MINYNWLIYAPMIEDAEAMGISDIKTYLHDHWGAYVRNGTWIIFDNPKKEALFQLKFSQYFFQHIPDWAEIMNENGNSNP